MDVETTPEQAEPVLAALAEALGGREPGPDPWWQAGLEEALET
jgi:hypothetical protein